jgi:hypothetical protein
MKEAWRELRVGDRVRIVRMPWDVDAPGYFFAPETRRLYKKLIARNRPVRVYQVDEYGCRGLPAASVGAMGHGNTTCWRSKMIAGSA